MTTAIQPKNTMVIQQYGDSNEVYSLAKRIKVMVPGGSKLTDHEAQALAQVSLVTQCNPFIGEIWYIPGRGPMIGIKGARRHGNETVKKAGGDSAYFTADLRPCAGDVAGYKGDIKDLAAAYECTVEDSVSTKLYQAMFLETLNALRQAGSPDPVGEAREICGKRPQWKGYGYSTVSETSKMNKQALAMKRAEADGLKRRFDIPFGTEVASGDNAMEVEGSWTETPPSTLAQTVDEAFPPAQEATELPPQEIVSVLSEWAVTEAAKFWNIDKAQAVKAINKKFHGNMEKREFLAALKET